ncbi:MAG: hypothetical protein GH152_02700 [Dehalococcoidia bacterium]|nr:hypothetical protein [Dehalococcoidia bacterium]
MRLLRRSPFAVRHALGSQLRLGALAHPRNDIVEQMSFVGSGLVPDQGVRRG